MSEEPPVDASGVEDVMAFEAADGTAAGKDFETNDAFVRSVSEFISGSPKTKKCAIQTIQPAARIDRAECHPWSTWSMTASAQPFQAP